LIIANSHGWFILSSAPFTAEWNGGEPIGAATVRALDDSGPLIADSHFGRGVLTFTINALFRTEPGHDLMVTGPSNMFKDAMQPLSGVVETDWRPSRSR
jgi:hypothetical protein